MGELNREGEVLVLVSADAEWRAVRAFFPQAQIVNSPMGEWFDADLEAPRNGNTPELPAQKQVRFFHGGWGKIAAAASTQYVIDRWQPGLLINLGTCGGFAGEIERGEIVLVERTIVYDIYEQMGDPDAHLAHYETRIDLSWLDHELRTKIRRTTLVSGDRDLFPGDIPDLKARFGAVAGDWESGAIAYVAAQNGVRCLILRGVTDLVGEGGSEAYGNPAFFETAAAGVMTRLLENLSQLLERTYAADPHR